MQIMDRALQDRHSGHIVQRTIVPGALRKLMQVGATVGFSLR